MDACSKHSTHSFGFIECDVASNKVVSARKKTRSAHVDIANVERFRMREGKKEERLKVNYKLRHACSSIFILYPRA